MSVVESERLILRPPRHADIQAMTVWLGDYQVSRNLARVPFPYSEADAEDFVAKRGRHGDGHYAFTIARKADNLFMGGIGLHLEDAGHEFGYWLGKPFWGLGYASEAARALALFAFESLDAPFLCAGRFHDNPASGHVLAKLGARHNGSRMRDCASRGVKVLCHEMLLTREAFLSKKAA
ncbi:MAG TPA: GNAT family N-acetyltransferase [Rhizomicrobium sp.]|nr:GNAT family N-acetyltransferase [Rhizomicrobium sp.]